MSGGSLGRFVSLRGWISLLLVALGVLGWPEAATCRCLFSSAGVLLLFLPIVNCILMRTTAIVLVPAHSLAVLIAPLAFVLEPALAARPLVLLLAQGPAPSLLSGYWACATNMVRWSEIIVVVMFSLCE